MASYLDKSGLTTLWSKVKSYVSSNYLSLGGGALNGEVLAKGFQINSDWPAVRWATADAKTVFVLAQANPSTNQLTFHLKRGGSNVWDSNEAYSLPAPNLNLTTTVSYDILTSKNAVTIAQGGTGATTAAGARSALGITPANIGALPISGGTLTGALNFKNATLNNLGDDVAFGDQDRAGSFCIKGLNSTTRLRFLPYSSDDIEIGLAAAGTNLWISSSIIVEDGTILLKRDNSPTLALSNSGGAAVGAFGSYSTDGSHAANYIRTYTWDGYHDFVFDNNGTFGTKQIYLHNTTNPYLAFNDSSGIVHYIQQWQNNLYIGPGTSEGIVYSPSNKALYKASNWWAYMTGYWDANTATLTLGI